MPSTKMHLGDQHPAAIVRTAVNQSPKLKQTAKDDLFQEGFLAAVIIVSGSLSKIWDVKRDLFLLNQVNPLGKSR